jgi:hypothetical protein
MERRVAKVCAPVIVRNPPDIFILTFIMRMAPISKMDAIPQGFARAPGQTPRLKN